MYTLYLTISEQAFIPLRETKAKLVLLCAVRTSGPGLPLVWQSYSLSAPIMQIQWDPHYAAFTAPEPLKDKAVLKPTQNRPLTLGQQLLLDESGIGQVVDGTLPAAIELNNQSSQLLTSGLSLVEPQGGSACPFCAFDLHGNSLLAIEPVARVLLAFSTAQLVPGQAIEQLLAQSVLVDLAASPTASLTYELDGGWQLGDASAQLFEAGHPLVDLLIERALSQPA